MLEGVRLDACACIDRTCTRFLAGMRLMNLGLVHKNGVATYCVALALTPKRVCPAYHLSLIIATQRRECSPTVSPTRTQVHVLKFDVHRTFTTLIAHSVEIVLTLATTVIAASSWRRAPGPRRT